MDELVIDNLVYIPSRRAAEITGYAKDYIGQLCREGRIEAKLVGRSWYVLESSVREHRFGTAMREASMATPPVEVKEEVRDTEPLAQVAEPVQVIEETWESPVYTPEEVKPIVEIDHPTYLTNTNHKSEGTKTQIEEVQSAWQEWFSKNNSKNTTSVPEEENSEEEVPSVEVPLRKEVEEVEESGTEEVVSAEGEMRQEDEPVSVPLRTIRSPYAGSMDIGPREPMEARITYADQPQARIVKERRVPQKRSTLSGGVIRALSVGVMILAAAVAIIGSGSLDAISPSWAKDSVMVEYLAGVTNFER